MLCVYVKTQRFQCKQDSFSLGVNSYIYCLYCTLHFSKTLRYFKNRWQMVEQLSVIFSQEDILSRCIQIFENFLPATSIPDDLAPGVSGRMVCISPENQHFSDFLRHFVPFAPFQMFRNFWSSTKHL